MPLQALVTCRSNLPQLGARHSHFHHFTNRQTRSFTSFLARTSHHDNLVGQSQDLEVAWTLLQEFTKKEARGLAQTMMGSREKRQALRDALLLAASHPWPEAGYSLDSEILLGVLASDVRLGVRSLRDYCAALNVDFILPTSRIPNAPTLPSIQSSVYIKYNSKSGLCYVTAYEGRDRGVLVNLGTVQIGHIPLGIFDEEQKKEFSLPTTS